MIPDRFDLVGYDNWLMTAPHNHYTQENDPYERCACDHISADHNPESGACLATVRMSRTPCTCQEFGPVTKEDAEARDEDLHEEVGS